MQLQYKLCMYSGVT